jgi:LmbE family N-acetylglucosaminyl deacetylase
MMIITDGSAGGETDVRSAEQLDAAKVIGAKDVFFGGYLDTKFECHRESIMKIEEIVRQVEPNTVYTHFGEDMHQDHRHIAWAVVPAARSVKNLLFFEGWSSQ